MGRPLGLCSETEYTRGDFGEWSRVDKREAHCKVEAARALDWLDRSIRLDDDAAKPLVAQLRAASDPIPLIVEQYRNSLPE